MVKLTNTADRRDKAHLHRKAIRHELEPMLGNQRIRLNCFITITDEQYKAAEALITRWVNDGIVEVVRESTYRRVPGETPNKDTFVKVPETAPVAAPEPVVAKPADPPPAPEPPKEDPLPPPPPPPAPSAPLMQETGKRGKKSLF